MRRIRSLVVPAVFLLQGLAALGADDSPEVRKLLVERRDTLRRVVKGREDEVKIGRCSLETLIISYRDLRRAELAAAATPAEKAAALESLYRAACAQDERILQLADSGFASVTDCLMMRAERQAAEIELRRAGGKPPADVKPAREIKKRAPEKPKD
jgi:hypothetical protein